MKFQISILSTIVLVSGCASNKENPTSELVIPSYVTIPPITLPPIASEIKDSLLTIAQNTKGAKVLPYDMDLLVLPASSVKAQYSFFDADMGAGSGMFALGGSTESRRVVYDVMQMATYPMPVVLKVLDDGSESNKTIYISPFIGVGIRITVEYESSEVKGNLSLPALAAELSSNKGSGSISIEQYGISRYGSSNQSFTGMEITPDNIAALYRNISTIMAQIWLEDTSIQPMLVGYSIPGYANIPARYHSQIVDQLATTARKREIIAEFGETMFREGKKALLLNGELISKDSNAATSKKYNELMSALEELYKVEIRRGDVVTTIALTHPEKLKNVTNSSLEITIPDSGSSISTEEATQKIIGEIDTNIQSTQTNDDSSM